MYTAGLKSLLYLVFFFPPLLFLQRSLQREIQSVFLLTTRQPEISMALFSLIFLPGVLLHETSHYLMARLLGVRTGRFSIVPQKMGNGRLQLGYVETASTDFFRDSLIGIAPLIAGVIFIAYIGASRLGLNELWVHLSLGEMEAFRQSVKSIFEQPDFWLWFYLTFTISSTMMPSPSDRRAWLPLILILAILLGLILFLGVGSWVFSHFGKVIVSALDTITAVTAITVLIHLLLLPPIWVIRKIISRITGFQVV